jgi:hypothetical protein
VVPAGALSVAEVDPNADVPKATPAAEVSSASEPKPLPSADVSETVSAERARNPLDVFSDPR